MEHVEYVTKRAMELASALGYLRGAIIGELLYSNLTPTKFTHTYEVYKRSYELGGDEMDTFDITRIRKRAEELGLTI